MWFLEEISIFRLLFFIGFAYIIGGDYNRFFEIQWLVIITIINIISKLNFCQKETNMQTNQSEDSKEKTTLKKKNTNMLLASFILFVFPIVAVFIGVFLGQYVGKLIGAPFQISRVFGGIIAFGLAIVLIKLFDKHAVMDAKEEKIHWEDL